MPLMYQIRNQKEPNNINQYQDMILLPLMPIIWSSTLIKTVITIRITLIIPQICRLKLADSELWKVVVMSTHLIHWSLILGTKPLTQMISRISLWRHIKMCVSNQYLCRNTNLIHLIKTGWILLNLTRLTFQLMNLKTHHYCKGESWIKEIKLLLSDNNYNINFIQVRNNNNKENHEFQNLKKWGNSTEDLIWEVNEM